MTNRRTFHRTTFALACWLLASAPAAAFAQDALSRAKGLYASAEYEEALQLLATLKGKNSNTEAEAYQVFCLVALGRATKLARPSNRSCARTRCSGRRKAQVSPRIRSFFDDVRKPLLPEIARLSYAKAKTAFDQKDWAPALAEFDRVIALVEELGASEQGSADLRTLAVGFRELTRAALAPPPTPPPAPTPTPTPVAPPVRKIYSDEDSVGVVRPVPTSTPLPEWRPNTIEARMNFAGSISLVIGEQGYVVSTRIEKSVNPRYDGPLLEAAKKWQFQPATKDGVPVQYRYVLTVKLAGK